MPVAGEGADMNVRTMMKRMAEGGMLVAALLLATPLDALACTQIYVGKDLTETGDTYVGRSEDYSSRYAKFFGVQESMTNPRYTSDESDFDYTFQGTTYRYTYVRDSVLEWGGGSPAPYSEAGTNEKGVSVSATETTNMNSAIRSVDPMSDTGIGEFNIADVVLGQADSARDGVKLLGSIIDEYGSCECNQIIIADSSETWIFMQLSGTQWMAIKMPSDVVSVNPNLGDLQFKVDLDDESECLHSADIEKVAQEAGSYVTYSDGTMNVAKSYGRATGGSVRYIQGHLYYGDDMQEGTDYTVSNGSVSSIADLQLMFTPNLSSKVTLTQALRAYAARGEQSDSPAVNANLGASGAIGGQSTTETTMFQIRSGLSSDIATVEWVALSPAEFNVFLPAYGALLTDVDESYYPDFSTTDISHADADATEDGAGTVLDFIFMDINTLASQNRSSMAPGVRAYLDAVQQSIVDQQEVVDQLMQSTPAGSARTELANKAFRAESDALYAKTSTLLTEMRAYVSEGDTSEQFVPSDYDADNASLKTPLVVADTLSAPSITAQPASASYTAGAKATALTVAAEAAYDADALTYQWYVADGSVTPDSKLTDFMKVEGATEATYTPSAAAVGSKTYVVVVTNAAGLSTMSEPAVIAVKAATSDNTKPGTSGLGDTTDTKKPTSTKNPTDTNKPTSNNTTATKPAAGTMPATGDVSFEAVAAAAVLGVVLVGAGVATRRRARK